MRRTNKKIKANKPLRLKTKKRSQKKTLKASPVNSISKKVFMTYTSARQFIIKQKVTTKNQFQVWSSSKKRPKAFPSNPRMTYKNEWKGWGHFLGTGRVQTQRKMFMSYNSARQFIKKQKVTTKNQFQVWSSSKKRPDNFPSNPRSKYEQQWKGWGHFLSTGRTPENRKNFMSYKKAQQIIKKQKIQSKPMFEKWSRTKKRPDNFPSNPGMTYKKQWKGWGYFLGTGRTAEKRKNFINYKKAQQLIRKQKIQSKPMFEKWSRTKKRPDNFPSNPHQVYFKNWKGWKSFLGTKR